MMHYVCQCSVLSMQAVLNGILKTMGADDSWEVGQTCCNIDSESDYITGFAHFIGNNGKKKIINELH